MSTESSQGPAQAPGGKTLNTGPALPDPFVAGLASGDTAIGGPDQPDPFVAGLAEEDGPTR